jgi:hypothetical protein
MTGTDDSAGTAPRLASRPPLPEVIRAAVSSPSFCYAPSHPDLGAKTCSGSWP